MSVQTKLMMVDEFWRLYGDRPDEVVDGILLNYELIEGEVVDVSLPKRPHAAVQARLLAQLTPFVDQKAIGEIYGEMGYQLSAITLRGPDASFVGKAKLATLTGSEDYMPFAPDLAVEIVSPSNSANDIQQKVNLYLAAGTALVWVVYPKLRQVIVHTKNGARPPISMDGTLDGGDVLSGLAIPVASIFPPEAAKE